MASLHANQRSDLSLFMNSFDIIGSEREFEGFRITSHHLMDDIDLLKNGADRDGTGQCGWDINRPELPPYSTGLKTWNISHHGRFELAGVGPEVDTVHAIGQLAILPWHIIVTINKRDLAQNG